MSDLERDTRLEGGDGRYRAEVSRDWEAVPGSPAGGYLAALALRAAGRETALRRPVSLACQFVQAPRFGEVEVQVSPLHESERTAALRVSMTQSEAPTLEALVWAAADDLPGYAVEFAPIPEFPGPEGLPSVLDAAREQGGPLPRSWLNTEFRARWPAPWADGVPRDPVAQAWHRFAPHSSYDDPFVDAGRIAVLAVAGAWGPLFFHTGSPIWALPYLGPNIDLNVQFHRDSRTSEWVLVEGRVPAASSGIVHSQLGMWSTAGSLIASANTTLICQRNPLSESGTGSGSGTEAVAAA